MKAKTIFRIPIILLGIILITGVTNVQSQLLFEENFDYPIGENLTDHNWTRHSGTTNPITVTSPGLIYTNYPSVSGNAALLDNDGEDVSRNFTEQTSGTIYVSFLVDVSNIPTGGYFLHLGATSMGTTYCARVWVTEETGGDIEFAITKKSSSPSYTSNDYSKNTTYLLVLKYEFIAGSSNDKISLFVFSDPDLPSTEPGTPTQGPIDENTQTDPANLGTIALRQFDSNQNIKVDGIRIGYTWGDAPIPVELTSFTAFASDNYVKLSWITATETENLGFHVFRSMSEKDDYTRITNELIKGVGSSDQAHSYAYTDNNVEPGKTYYYKLADVDFSGNMKFHGPISVTVEAVPTNYSLKQNYPNPFNPVTLISFTLREAGKVSLRIYNLHGQVVRTLIDEEKQAGCHSVMWNGTDENGEQISNGTYLYNLKVNRYEQTKKLVFMK